MATRQLPQGYFHKGRVIFAVYYTTDDGHGLVVWFNREGDAISGDCQLRDPARRIVTTKPGDELWTLGRWWRIARVKVWRESREFTASDWAWWNGEHVGGVGNGERRLLQFAPLPGP